MPAFFKNLPKSIAALAAVVLLCGVSFVDYLVGFDVSLSVFYALPIVLGVWTVDRRFGTVLTAIAAALWYTAEIHSGHEFSSHWIPIWNASGRFCFLLMIVAGTYFARRQFDQNRMQARVLEQVLPVCSCCKKISDEHGAWIEVETFLSEHLPARAETKLCPDCAKRTYIEKVSPNLPSIRSA